MRFISLLLALLFATPALAESSVQNENTRATLIASQDGIKPGGDITLGLLLTPRAGWHTYWENPGDAGIPTTLEWSLPEAIKAGPVQWPLPTILREDTLAIYGYKDEVLLPVNITIPANYSDKNLLVSLHASWLVCDNICVPESADLTLDIPVTDAPHDSAETARFASAKAALPQMIDTPLGYRVNGENFELALPDTVNTAGEVYFFPREENKILYAKPQIVKDHTLLIPRNVNDESAESLSGYLSAGGKGYEIRADRSTAAAAAATPMHQYSYFGLLLFALLGGLILNLMPCVLPVLSLKAFAIAQKTGHHKRVVVLQALAYTLGVLVSFAVIAGVLIGLEQAGATIGWGFQMQSPPFVGFLAILLFLVGLNLAGMFELPVLFGNSLSDTPRHTLRGSFFTGVLATAVATPCTAPFMATAVGATLTLSPVLGFFIFMAIGLGLSLPFLLIAICPKLISYLPKPGAWMESFKQLMAFPMFASVVWLLWVLVQQTGAHGLLAELVTMLLLAFIIWLKGHCRDASIYCRIAILLVMLAALANGLSELTTATMPAKDMAFSEKTLADLRAEKRPVFVDATAAWCLTCQVNRHVAIDTPATRAALAETGTTLLIADWTNRDAEITAFLKRFGYNGVPLYIYFPAEGEPVVLPQLLSESLVISTLKGQPQ